MAYSIKIAAGKFHHYQWIPFPVHRCGAIHPFAGKWMGQTTRPTNTHHPPLSSHQPPTICHTHLQPQVYFILSTQQQTTRLSPLYFIMITIIMLIIIMTCWLRMSTTDHDYAAAAASALTTTATHPQPASATTTIELQRCRCRVCASDRLLMVHAGIWVHLLD